MTPDEFREQYDVPLYANTEDPSPGNPVVAIRPQRRARPDLPAGTVLDSDDDSMWVPDGRGCWIWCPGCDMAHRPMIRGEAGDEPAGPCWGWNGRDDTGFGIDPSLLVHATGTSPLCHSFIHAGEWQFLSDCTHALAGRTVPMVALPDWLVR